MPGFGSGGPARGWIAKEEEMDVPIRAMTEVERSSAKRNCRSAFGTFLRAPANASGWTAIMCMACSVPRTSPVLSLRPTSAIGELENVALPPVRPEEVLHGVGDQQALHRYHAQWQIGRSGDGRQPRPYQVPARRHESSMAPKKVAAPAGAALAPCGLTANQALWERLSERILEWTMLRVI